METPKLTQKIAMKLMASLGSDIYHFDERQVRNKIAFILEKSGDKRISFAMSLELSKKYTSQEILDIFNMARKFKR